MSNIMHLSSQWVCHGSYGVQTKNIWSDCAAQSKHGFKLEFMISNIKWLKIVEWTDKNDERRTDSSIEHLNTIDYENLKTNTKSFMNKQTHNSSYRHLIEQFKHNNNIILKTTRETQWYEIEETKSKNKTEE